MAVVMVVAAHRPHSCRQPPHDGVAVERDRAEQPRQSQRLAMADECSAAPV